MKVGLLLSTTFFSFSCGPWATALFLAEPVLPPIDTGYNDMYSAARDAGACETVLDSIELLEERADIVSFQPPVSILCPGSAPAISLCPLSDIQDEPLPEPRRMPRKLTATAVSRAIVFQSRLERLGTSF